MIDQIDDILFYLRDSDSKKPMQAETLAAKLEVSMPRFEEMMNIICDIVPAPVNRAYKEVSENKELNRPAFKGYVYWPTGVVEKAKRQHISLSSPKPARQPIRTEISTQKVLPDTYETPVFGQTPAVETAVAEIKKIIDTPAEEISASTSPDYSDKPKAYQILKYIEANPWKTNREIQRALDLKASIDGYISPYLAHIEIDKIEIGELMGMRIFKVMKPVDEFYGVRKPYTKKQPAGASKDEAKPIPQQPEETTAQSALDAQAPAAEPVRVAVPEVQESATQNHQDEVVHDHPASKVRFAITSDKHIILMGLAAEDIELTEGDSHTLIQFCGDIALAANVSSVLASKVIDLETLGS